MTQLQIRTIAVSSPGGSPRHFRVQFRTEPREIWKRSAAFSDHQLAQQCALELEKSGVETRVVPFRLPTAA